ncbi:MAG: ABC transporter permease [Chloroflexi bacterium]|nr:ABC transporter permease [Chloroflexota bacterium]MCL5075876.1 ABC transporter permease [Chloroflexota bacterium]
MAGYFPAAFLRWEVILPLIPALFFFLLFLILPLIATFRLSLEPNVLVQSKETGFGNYIYYFQKEFYINVLWRTLRISVLTVFFALLIGYPLAYILKNLSAHLGSTLILGLSFPILGGPLIVVLGWMILLANGGPLNEMLMSIGLLEGPLELLSTEKAVVISLVQFTLSFVVLNIFNALIRIDPALTEAASSLGANNVRAFIHITWPLSLPGVLSATLIAFSLSMSAFVSPHYLGGDANLVVTTLITQFMLSTFNWQMASTAAVILLVIALVIMFFYNKVVSQAIKGGSG